MNPHRRLAMKLSRPILLLTLFAAFFLSNRPADAYSVLSHEEVVDMAWKTQIIPMLKARFPGISDDEIRIAHSYAYGGSVIQDIGYYPFGSHYFSDLLHYVRPGDFVGALIRDSKTPNEYAFALGALAHYCGDTVGHPFINQVTSMENPHMREQFGHEVTYADNPTAHVRTEFGFDVVMVAHGLYSQEDYRDFVGFQVTKPLLEQAFLETYGIPMNSVIKHEDLAISTYRHAVSGLIPKMTKVAFVSYKDQIEAAAPGTEKNKFIYRLNQTEYRKDFGKEYTHVGFWGTALADILRFLPKVGPLKALKVTIPNAQEQVVYLKSMNATVDKFKIYLAQIEAAPAPLPLPDPKDALDARKAADKLGKDVVKADKRAEKAKDPDEKAMKETAAQSVAKAAAVAADAAERTQAKVDAIANAETPPPTPRGSVPLGTPIQPPSTPRFADLDMDTGMPAADGEYPLADATYVKLLDSLVNKLPTASAPAAPVSSVAATLVSTSPAAPAPTAIDPALAANIEKFFAQRAPPTSPKASAKQAARMAAAQQQIQANLAKLKSMDAAPATPAAGSR